jgi:transposase InsO family protein
VARYRAEGEVGLLDRSSAPGSIPHRISEQRIEAIAALRGLRFTGPEIAECLGMALSSVSGILTRIGMGLIRTLLSGWAYGALYRNSAERTAALDGWLWYYNHQRRHSALAHKPPIARLNERTNLLGTYT